MLFDRCHVILEVPTVSGGSSTCTLSQGGDCAAAHSGAAIDSPINRCGICFRCLARKKDWFNLDVLTKTPRRNFAYQCVANHINVYKLLGPTFADREPPSCPHCKVRVDDALMAKEKLEWDEATEEQRKEITRVHSASHYGGLRGRAPIAPMDNRRRARSALHRRMNAASNNITATFMKVPFDVRMRQAANAVLAKARDVAWRFPEKKKKRASTPTGNSARAFHTIPWLLEELFRIFYPDLSEQDQAALQQLGAAAAAANGGAAGGGGARPAAPAASKPKKKRKAVKPIATVGGVQMTGADQSAYVTDRRADAATPAPPTAPPTTLPLLDAAVVNGLHFPTLRALADKRGLPHTGVSKPDLRALLIAKYGAAAAPAATPPTDTEPVDDTAACNDDSLEVDVDANLDQEPLLGEEDEDVVMGGAASAIEVWRTSIIHQSDCYAEITDHFDMDQRRAYGEKGQASGRAWALALQAAYPACPHTCILAYLLAYLHTCLHTCTYLLTCIRASDLFRRSTPPGGRHGSTCTIPLPTSSRTRWSMVRGIATTTPSWRRVTAARSGWETGVSSEAAPTRPVPRGIRRYPCMN